MHSVFLLACRVSTVPFSASFNIDQALPRPAQDPVDTGMLASAADSASLGVRGSSPWALGVSSMELLNKGLVPGASTLPAGSHLEYWIPGLQQIITQELGRGL